MTTEQQAENLAAIQNPNEKVVALETPISFGGQTINELIIRKPNVTALAGVSLQALYQSDVDAVCKVIPKITSPQIPREAVPLIDPVDLAEIAGSIIYFLMPKSQQKLLTQS